VDGKEHFGNAAPGTIISTLTNSAWSTGVRNGHRGHAAEYTMVFWSQDTTKNGARLVHNSMRSPVGLLDMARQTNFARRL